MRTTRRKSAFPIWTAVDRASKKPVFPHISALSSIITEPQGPSSRAGNERLARTRAGEYEKKARLKPQRQKRQPGLTEPMKPSPADEMAGYRGSEKLAGKVAIITGGDSGIGRSVAIAFAKEGADVIVAYLNEHDDARRTARVIEKIGQKAMLVSGDIGSSDFCERLVQRSVRNFGGIDILVNNAAEQHPESSLERITEEQLTRTFCTNVFSLFYLTKAALPHMKKGSVIINTASVTAYKGNPNLLDYSATKGAIIAFTRSLSQSLAQKGIRVNAVAPGPIWTPLIPSTFDAEKVGGFGKDTPMGRVGQPDEVAPCYVFLASEDSTYMTGQTLHPNGGVIVNG